MTGFDGASLKRVKIEAAVVESFPEEERTGQAGRRRAERSLLQAVTGRGNATLVFAWAVELDVAVGLSAAGAADCHALARLLEESLGGSEFTDALFDEGFDAAVSALDSYCPTWTPTPGPTFMPSGAKSSLNALEGALSATLSLGVIVVFAAALALCTFGGGLLGLAYKKDSRGSKLKDATDSKFFKDVDGIMFGEFEEFGGEFGDLELTAGVTDADEALAKLKARKAELQEKKANYAAMLAQMELEDKAGTESSHTKLQLRKLEMLMQADADERYRAKLAERRAREARETREKASREAWQAHKAAEAARQGAQLDEAQQGKDDKDDGRLGDFWDVDKITSAPRGVDGGSRKPMTKLLMRKLERKKTQTSTLGNFGARSGSDNGFIDMNAAKDSAKSGGRLWEFEEKRGAEAPAKTNFLRRGNGATGKFAGITTPSEDDDERLKSVSGRLWEFGEKNNVEVLDTAKNFLKKRTGATSKLAERMGSPDDSSSDDDGKKKSKSGRLWEFIEKRGIDMPARTNFLRRGSGTTAKYPRSNVEKDLDKVVAVAKAKAAAALKERSRPTPGRRLSQQADQLDALVGAPLTITDVDALAGTFDEGSPRTPRTARSDDSNGQASDDEAAPQDEAAPPGMDAEMAQFLRAAGIFRHAQKLADLGFLDMDILSDTDVLSDSVLSSEVGMPKFHIRKIRAELEAYAVGSTPGGAAGASVSRSRRVVGTRLPLTRSFGTEEGKESEGFVSTEEKEKRKIRASLATLSRARSRKGLIDEEEMERSKMELAIKLGTSI